MVRINLQRGSRLQRGGQLDQIGNMTLGVCRAVVVPAFLLLIAEVSAAHRGDSQDDAVCVGGCHKISPFLELGVCLIAPVQNYEQGMLAIEQWRRWCIK